MARDSISRFCRVIFFFLSFGGGVLLASELYILSYKTQVKDTQILNQSLFTSLAMTPTNKKVFKNKNIFLSKQCAKINFFSCYEHEILEFLLSADVYINSRDRSEKLVATTFSELQIRPQYVQVEFNDTFVKMSLLK